MALEQGTLIVRKKKGKTLVQIQIGDKPAMTVVQGEVSQSLMKQLDAFNGKEVEFERIGGQPKQVREPGGVFIGATSRASATSPAKPKHDRSSTGNQRSRAQPHPGQRVQSTPRATGNFHNPYNFIPAPPRNTNDSELGDHEPVAQDTFALDRYTGVIRVQMVAKTPLLVPDTEQVQEENGHKTFPLRMGADGKPLIPASSVRGILRSAYEAVTNSRFGRFSKSHRISLQYRETQKPYRKVNYPASPWDLLDESLRPASSIDELSPADRVFGWVRTDADRETLQRDARVAARGLLRVGPVTCESTVNEAVETFSGDGVPLAILSTPKLQQGRFYVAASPQGEAQQPRLSKIQAGYTMGKGLRGRKVYPHQAKLPAGHWSSPMEDRTQKSVGTPAQYQEYRRPRKDGQEQRDDQNRSIRRWVKPGAQFSFDLHIHNLSSVELGALLWLLKLPEAHYFRFGGGKPLGFGSVRLTIETCDVRTGAELSQRYRSWYEDSTAQDPSDQVIEAFKKALTSAYPRPNSAAFEDIPFIQAFIRSCQGYLDGLPVHYPRSTKAPNPEGESFKWFVANEKSGQHALADLVDDPGLPRL